MTAIHQHLPVPFENRSWSSMSAPSATLVRMPEELLYSSRAEPAQNIIPSFSGGDDMVLLTFNNTLSEPPPPVYRFMRRLAKPTGMQLLHLLRQARELLLQGILMGTGGSKSVGHTLRDVHATVLEVDDDLTDCQASPEDAELVQLCRHWLKQVQAFVLGLQKDVEYLAMSEDMSVAHDDAWRKLLEHAREKMLCLVPEQGPAAATQLAQTEEQQSPQQAQQQQQQREALHQRLREAAAPPTPAPAPVLCYKPVCIRSRLSYSRHWANKLCL